MTPDLRQFLTDWLHWAENGAPEGQPFFRALGLCANADEFKMNLEIELAHVLLETEGSFYFPFGYNAYFERKAKRTQHLCPKRLAWVREQLT